MKALLFGLMSLMILPASASWETNFEKAKQLAAQQHKNILLTFSGSDWCGPCIRLHKEIFESDEFKNFADSSLVLINADFPRAKKNQLSKEQQKENDFLADKYNANGNFPYTILLNASGKLLKIWDGYPKITPGEFINDIKSTTTGNK
jgi:thioredoxin-related protein